MCAYLSPSLMIYFQPTTFPSPPVPLNHKSGHPPNPARRFKARGSPRDYQRMQDADVTSSQTGHGGLNTPTRGVVVRVVRVAAPAVPCKEQDTPDEVEIMIQGKYYSRRSI